MNCTGLEGQIKEGEAGGGEFATRVMEDAINNESRERKLEIVLITATGCYGNVGSSGNGS